MPTTRHVPRSREESSDQGFAGTGATSSRSGNVRTTGVVRPGGATVEISRRPSINCPNTFAPVGSIPASRQVTPPSAERRIESRCPSGPADGTISIEIDPSRPTNKRPIPKFASFIRSRRLLMLSRTSYLGLPSPRRYSLTRPGAGGQSRHLAPVPQACRSASNQALKHPASTTMERCSGKSTGMPMTSSSTGTAAPTGG